MSSPASRFSRALQPYIEPEKATHLPKFFRAVPGGYGEGDRFLGVRVPNIRKVAKTFYTLHLGDVALLLHSPLHEIRLGALFILVHHYPKEPEEVVACYLANLEGVNNWDLVDSSAYQILGHWLLTHDDVSLLFDFAASRYLWHRRIAIMATFAFIKAERFDLTLALAETLLYDSHDLIHKAVGWMLREIGNRDRSVLENFLLKHAAQMPRTMLRYAIEKLPETERKKYLSIKKST